jgi:hypothetical protein
MFEPTEVNLDVEDTHETRKAFRMARPKNVARSLRVTAKVALALAQRMEATERLSGTMGREAQETLLTDLKIRTEYLVELSLWALRTQERRDMPGSGKVYKHPQSTSTYWYER